MKAGDIIVHMGDLPIKDIQDDMEALGKFVKWQTVPIKVKGRTDAVTLDITF